MKHKVLLPGILILFLLCCSFGCQSAAVEQKSEIEQPDSMIEKVSNLVIISENASELYNFFIDKCKLQAAWPYESLDGYTGGGVSAGNVFFEIIKKEGIYEEQSSGINYIGFEVKRRISYIQMVMKNKGFTCSNFAQNGGFNSMVDLDGFLNEGALFFIRYHIPFYPSIMNKNPMQIESVKEITLSVADYKKSLERWALMLEPAEPVQSGYWQLGDGPGIQLIEGAEDEIISLQFKVKSLQIAKQFLKDNNMLGEVYDDSIFTDPAASYNILFEFKE